MVAFIPPSRVREVVRDLLAPLVQGGALWLGPKYLRGCTSGKCANESTCDLRCLFAVFGSVEACGPPPSGLFFRWRLPPHAKRGALLHSIDLDLETCALMIFLPAGSCSYVRDPRTLFKFRCFPRGRLPLNDCARTRPKFVNDELWLASAMIPETCIAFSNSLFNFRL